MNNYGHNYPVHDPPPPYPQSTGRGDEDFRITSIAARHEVMTTGALEGESTEAPPPYYTVVPPCTFGDARIAPTGVQRHEVEVTIIAQPDYSRESYKCHVVLACFVLWSGNCIFGLIAYILAAQAERAKRLDHKVARRLGRGSLSSSISGLVITAIVISLIIQGSYLNCDSAHTVNGHCYAYRRYVHNDPSCSDTFSSCCQRYENIYWDGYCYGNYQGPRPSTSTTSVTTTTTTTRAVPSVTTCLPELFVYGRCFRSRRVGNSNWSCRGTRPSILCCYSNETYAYGYCYS